MDLELITSQVVGLSNDSKWSQTMVEGNFIATIELISDGINSAKEESGVFLTGLLEIVNRHKPQEKEAFKRIVSQYIGNTVTSSRIYSLVVGLKVSNNLFLFCHGNGSAILKRGDTWSEIVKGEGVASGLIVEGDLLVLTTQTFEKLMPHDMMISRFTEEQDPQAAGERIGALLHNFDDSKGAAAVFTVFKKPDTYSLTGSQSAPVLDKQDENTNNTDEIKSQSVVAQTEEMKDTSNGITPEPLNPETQNTSEEQLTHKELTHLEGVSLEAHSNIQKPLQNIPQVFEQEKGTGLLSKLQASLSKKDAIQDKTKLPLPSVSIATVVASPRKRVLVIALVLIGLLGASFLVIGGGRLTPSNAEVASKLESITHQVEEGEALSDLNALRSKIALKEAEAGLVPLIASLKKGTKERIEAEQLLTRARNTLSAVSKLYRVTPSVFADLSVVKTGAIGNNMAIYEDTIVVLDRINNSIMTIDNNGSVLIVGGGTDTPDPSLISIHGSNIFTLTNKGIVRVETSSKQQRVIVEDVSDISQAVDMVAYAGNVYVLDGVNKKVWKIAPSGSGYSNPRPYLSENETIPLNVSKMAIDGSIWILGENRVKKYVRGVEEFITFEGLDEPLVNASDIFIDDVSNYLYVYDAGENRVVIFDTDGIYHSQYILEGVGAVSEMVVSEKQGRLFLLSGSTIYEVNLHTEDFIKEEEL